MTKLNEWKVDGALFLICAATMVMSLATFSFARTIKVLHSFTGGSDGARPSAGLISDPAGNLYGTASEGGAYGVGVVFELSPSSEGSWAETVLHDFTGGEDGSGPYAGLISDSLGNLYGTTREGGAYGRGIVFELTPGSSGWNETVLHSFCKLGVGRCSDGDAPSSDLSFDSAGDLYGTTIYGGHVSSPNCPDKHLGCGVVFELTSTSEGAWTETVLHAFNGKDGVNPNGGVIFDALGNLYGATANGADLSCFSPYGCGVVFELIRNTDGTWTEQSLHVFEDKQGGAFPNGDLVFDSSGNLYGTAQQGGDLSCAQGSPYGCGVVFKLSPSAGSWSETVLHTFLGNDGAIPRGALVFDPKGSLHGTNGLGGDLSCPDEQNNVGCGVVFRLEPASRGTEYGISFTGQDGGGPFDGVIIDPADNIYTTTYFGGLYNEGVVFEIAQ